MNKFLIVLVGVFAISNAAIIHVASPYARTFIAPQTFAPAVIPSVVPAVVPSVSPYSRALLADDLSLVPSFIPSSEMLGWETYKEKFGKSYNSALEDQFRFGIYYANKLKIAKYDDLFAFGLGTETLMLDSFADFTREELFNLRSITEEADEEWQLFKEKYEKKYDDFEDKFRKTVYFITKDIIEAHNKIADAGFSTYTMGINQFTDFFHGELYTGALPMSSAIFI